MNDTCKLFIPPPPPPPPPSKYVVIGMEASFQSFPHTIYINGIQMSQEVTFPRNDPNDYSYYIWTWGNSTAGDIETVKYWYEQGETGDFVGYNNHRETSIINNPALPSSGDSVAIKIDPNTNNYYEFRVFVGLTNDWSSKEEQFYLIDDGVSVTKTFTVGFAGGGGEETEAETEDGCIFTEYAPEEYNNYSTSNFEYSIFGGEAYTFGEDLTVTDVTNDCFGVSFNIKDALGLYLVDSICIEVFVDDDMTIDEPINQPEGITSCVVSDDDTIVIVGANGMIRYSVDKGINFHSAIKTSGVITNTLRDVSYSSSSGFIAVGDSGCMLTSTDGITWDSHNYEKGKNILTVGYAKNGKMFFGMNDGNILKTLEFVSSVRPWDIE